MGLSEQNLTKHNEVLFKNVENLSQQYPKNKKLIFFQQISAYIKILKKNLEFI